MPDRAGSLVGAQIGVAARLRKPIWLAHGGADHDPYGHVEVGDEPFDHDRLLRVLLAEVGDLRRHDVEQLRHHGRHTFEVTGALLALESLAHASHDDARRKPRRIDLVGRRCEEQVDARLLRERGVARLVSWISGEVLGRAELQRVHERRHDDQIALGARGAQQRQMAVVERPHRWNEAHAQPRVRRRRKRPAKLGDRTDGSHLRRSSSHRDTGRD